MYSNMMQLFKFRVTENHCMKTGIAISHTLCCMILLFITQTTVYGQNIDWMVSNFESSLLKGEDAQRQYVYRSNDILEGIQDPSIKILGENMLILFGMLKGDRSFIPVCGLNEVISSLRLSVIRVKLNDKLSTLCFSYSDNYAYLLVNTSKEYGYRVNIEGKKENTRVNINQGVACYEASMLQFTNEAFDFSLLETSPFGKDLCPCK